MISKNSLIRDKVKEIEIIKHTNKIWKYQMIIFEKVIIANYTKLGINTKEKFLEFILSKNIDYGKYKKKTNYRNILERINS